MKWFLLLISLLWIALGSCYILYTGQTRKVMNDLLIKANHQKLFSVIAALTGLLFIFSASQIEAHQGFIVILGILAIAKGVFIFLNPAGLWDQLAAWYTEKISDQTYRLLGIITLILGAAVCSWVI